MRSVGEARLLPEFSVGGQDRAETTDVEAHMATYFMLLQIINSRLPTGSTSKLTCHCTKQDLSHKSRYLDK